MRVLFSFTTIFLFCISSVALSFVKGKEALLFQDMPTVVTASRQSLSVIESPATAAVISREDIEHMTFNNMSELLRYVAGIDFFKSIGSNCNIGMRGVNGLQANNVLVLVDGRPIFSPIRNTNQCALMPEVPDDIERVEVVKGPGSVLYGSNAFSGVINIITRNPESLSGTYVTSSVGTFDNALYSMTSGNRFGKWSYKLVASWTQESSMEDHDNQIKGLVKMSGEASYEMRPGEKATLSFGFSNGRLSVRPIASIVSFDQDGFDGFLRGIYQRDDLKMDVWWRHSETSGDFKSLGHVRWRYDNINLLFQDTFRTANHTLVYGFETRFASLGATTYDGWHNQFLGSVFTEDRWRISTDWNLFAGLRIDFHSEARFAISPRLSLVRFLSSNKSLRFSVASAFKYPSYLQNYIFLNAPFFSHQGNRDLEPENLTSIELAYQLWNPIGLSCTIAAFYNNYSNMIDYEFSYENNRFYLTYDNLYSMHQYGVELDGQYRFSKNFLVRLNYSYVWKYKRDGVTFGPVPTNQVNGEVRYDFDSGLWLDFRVHWQDTSEFSLGLSPMNLSSISLRGLTPQEIERAIRKVKYFSSWHDVDGYWLGDLSMGFRPPGKRWKVAVGVHNVFHERFEETSYGEKADTTFTAVFTMNF